MAFPFAAVLFDMDGVIADNTPLHLQVWTELARRHGLDPSGEEIARTKGRRAREVVPMLFGGLPPERIESLAKEREGLYAERLAAWPLQVVPGAPEFLERLGRLGIPRILATSAVQANVTRILDRLGLADCFDGFVTAHDVSRGKPDPEVYLKAAERAGKAPQQCLVAEDALPGVAAAKAAGACCLAIETSETAEALRRAGADFTVPDFRHLPPDLAAD